jgi:hypothetical protein
LRKRTFCLPETMISLPFGSKKRTRDESRRRVCFTCVRLMTQSRVARKNVELSSRRSQFRSGRRTRTVPSGRWMRVRSPQASRSKMSAVRISQHFLLSLRKTKSSGRSMRSSFPIVRLVGLSSSMGSRIRSVGAHGFFSAISCQCAVTCLPEARGREAFNFMSVRGRADW